MPEDPHRRDLTIFSLLNPRMPEEIVKYEIEEYLPTSLKTKVELASLDDLNFEIKKTLICYCRSGAEKRMRLLICYGKNLWE